MALFLTICSVLLVPAQAEEATFVDHDGALVIRMPAGWQRDSSREKGGVRFAAIRETDRTRYALFTVETGPATGFAPATWLDAEQKQLDTALQEVVTPFTVDRFFELGGKPAPFYSVAGRGAGYDVRIRAAALVHDGRLYRVVEHSYNDADAAAGSDLDRIWQGVAFQEGGDDAFQDEDEGYDDSEEEDVEDSGEASGPNLAPPEGAQPVNVEDKEGNFKLTFPPGWELTREPQPETIERIFARRQTVDGSDIMGLQVLRFTTARAETFTISSPTDELKAFAEERKFFEQYYGEGSAREIRPEVDESVLLGDADKSGAFEFRGITVQEQIKVNKAQKLRDRGDKTVKVPEYKPIVIRGRLALISPSVYYVICFFRRDVADHPEVIAEYKKVVDTWKFLETEPLPPPLAVAGVGHIEDTTADPACAKARKGRHVHIAKGNRIYKLEVKFVLPPGFQRIEKVGANISMLAVAQDKKNNWVRILVYHANANALGEKNLQYPPKQQQYAEWKSNWESKARGVKMKEKPRKVSLGRVRGDGYTFVEGTVEKFRGTFSALLFDKSGWRTFVEMETRGDGDKVFADEIRQFFKGLKFKKIK
jgi:hypothetical protein